MKFIHRYLPLIYSCCLAIQLISCRQQTIQQEADQPLPHRPRAIAVLYPDLSGRRPFIGTIQIKGAVYPYVAIDSTTYTYDSLGRLINRQLIQRSRPESNPQTDRLNVSTHPYVYTATKVIEPGIENPLDASQLRYASYSLPYFDRPNTLVDTLRRYSSEGILVESTIINRSVNPANPLVYRNLATIEAGDVVRLESIEDKQTKPYEVTTFTYDRSHNAPSTTQPLDGETSRHALLKKVFTRYWAGTTERVSWRYENVYDQQGRLSQQAKYYQPANSIQERLETITKFYY